MKAALIFLVIFISVASSHSKQPSVENCEVVRVYYPQLANEFSDFLKKKLPTHPKYKQQIDTYLRDLDTWQKAFRACFEKKIDP